MKPLLLLSFQVLLFYTAHAQDLIITTEGEALECKIVAVEEDIIEYTYPYGKKVNQSSIPRVLVKEYKIDHYNPALPHKGTFGLQSQSFPRLRVALDFGLSYRTGRLPEGLPQYLNQYMQEVKKGYHFGGYLGCVYNENFGFGFKANQFRSVSRIENISFTSEDGLVREGLLEDDIRISYFGPAFSSNIIFDNDQSMVFATASLGLIHYRNEATLIDPFLLSGSNQGFTLDLGYDKPVSKNLAWGIQLSFVAGAVTQMEIERGNMKESIALFDQSIENLSRLDLSVGIRFR